MRCRFCCSSIFSLLPTARATPSSISPNPLFNKTSLPSSQLFLNSRFNIYFRRRHLRHACRYPSQRKLARSPIFLSLAPPPSMGCFISTNSAAPPPHKARRTSSSAASAELNGGSKSPPTVDEETVKEVLFETPPAPRFRGSERMLHQNGGETRISTVAFSNDDPSPSDVDSEIHSTRSESFSTGNNGAWRWRPMLNSRSIPGEMKREKSPARRSDKPGSGYSRKTGGGDRSRSGTGSSKTGLHAGKSARKTGDYPGRIGYGSGERIWKGEEEGRVPPTNNELLESSLVSLESFIFL